MATTPDGTPYYSDPNNPPGLRQGDSSSELDKQQSGNLSDSSDPEVSDKPFRNLRNGR